MIISLTVLSDDSKPLDIPVTPDSINISNDVDNVTVNVANLGEVILKGKRKLKTISWSCFFPATNYDFCVSEPLADPNDYVKKIEKWMAKNYTIIVDIPGILSKACLITSFNPKPQGGLMDIYYDISFSEDRDVDLPDVKTQTEKRPTKVVVPHEYKWKKGDTWKKVAKKETGDSANYTKLRTLNEKRTKKAIKEYKKKHNVKTVKEAVALIGHKVQIK